MDELTNSGLPDGYRTLMQSDRVSRRTRQVLTTRMAEPDGPAVFDPAHHAALRALLDRVIPQDGPGIDLTARVAAMLAGGVGDGWRVATQPPDLEAYRAGLNTLDQAARAETGHDFAGLAPERQDAMLHAVAAGSSPDGTLTASQMKVWFADVCADAVRLYVADPRTLARMGYSGIGYGGDGDRLPGFTLMGPGLREPWEPLPERAP